MSHNASFKIHTNQTHGSQDTSNGAKKSKLKNIIFPVRSRTVANQRKIDNNIKEKLFQAKLRAYKDKQKSLLTSSRELIKIHQKCLRLSKQTSSPTPKDIEGIEHVVFCRTIA